MSEYITTDNTIDNYFIGYNEEDILEEEIRSLKNKNNVLTDEVERWKKLWLAEVAILDTYRHQIAKIKDQLLKPKNNSRVVVDNENKWTDEWIKQICVQ